MAITEKLIDRVLTHILSATDGRLDKVDCIFLEYMDKQFILKQKYTEAELSDFLKSIDFEFTESFQPSDDDEPQAMVDGKIIYTDGTHSESMYVCEDDYPSYTRFQYYKKVSIPTQCIR